MSVKKCMIALLVPLPSIFLYLKMISDLKATPPPTATGTVWCWSTIMMLWYHHPLLFANLLYFFNVNLLFWLIALIQSTHWMIDPYWTVMPVMLVHYYSAHPVAEYNWWRSRIVILLTWVWSLRLMHNYFRREKWQWGAREDWRFTDMRKHYGRRWAWASFFTIYLPHQFFLMGVSLPLYVVHNVNEPLTILDFVAILVCVSGIIIAYFADTQLYNFTTRSRNSNNLVLDTGLWYFCRHPNYFGEQLWWWGLVIFAWKLEGRRGWTFLGALANTMCLAYVTKLVEDRMLRQQNRAEAYRLYQKTTSVWLPWFKSREGGLLKTA